MSTDKKQFTLRMQDSTYEKVRYLAYVERRSMAMEIEAMILKYVSDYEQKHGEIKIDVERLYE